MLTDLMRKIESPTAPRWFSLEFLLYYTFLAYCYIAGTKLVLDRSNGDPLNLCHSALTANSVRVQLDAAPRAHNSTLGAWLAEQQTRGKLSLLYRTTRLSHVSGKTGSDRHAVARVSRRTPIALCRGVRIPAAQPTCLDSFERSISRAARLQRAVFARLPAIHQRIERRLHLHNRRG